ncbi:MAG TPA: DUF485 domain-containing protein [Vicinamibacterales bacterium]|nr:DUF485 domain-containing protein [Vicinamibacterales bacterium]
MTLSEHPHSLDRISASRRRVTGALTAAMMALYFGFILLVAFDKALLGRLVAPGLSLGILLGVLVIVAAWVLVGIYVAWANRSYDRRIAALRRQL